MEKDPVKLRLKKLKAQEMLEAVIANKDHDPEVVNQLSWLVDSYDIRIKHELAKRR